MFKISRHTNNSQSGIISIMMTVIMVIVISLIVLGLAQISRREQRQSTDNQLNAQAFYAAESGVNDVVALLKSGSFTQAQIKKTGCANGGIYSGLTPTLSTGVSYSCVLVDPAPGSETGTFGSKPSVFSLQTDASLTSVTFTWGPNTGHDGSVLTGCPSALANSDLFVTGDSSEDWTCAYPVLRVDVVDAATPNRTSLINNTKTVFVVPGSSGSLGAGNTSIRGATCNTATLKCSYTLTGLSGTSNYARITGIYGSGIVDITPPSGVNFSNVVTIDVTGKAQDVLRRIKVTANLDGSNQNGDGGAAILSGNDICKRFKIHADGTADTDACAGGP